MGILNYPFIFNLWFGIKTLHRLFLTKGNIKKFWNEI